MYAHGPACKLIDLQSACKFRDLCAFWNLLEHFGTADIMTSRAVSSQLKTQFEKFSLIFLISKEPIPN